MKTEQLTTNRDIISVKNDIARISALIDKRWKWLNDPVNRRRTTWKTVYNDTQQLVEQLQELEDELKYLSQH